MYITLSTFKGSFIFDHLLFGVIEVDALIYLHVIKMFVMILGWSVGMQNLFLALQCL